MLIYTGMQRTAIISNQYTSTLNTTKKYMYEILNIIKEAKTILVQKNLTTILVNFYMKLGN